MLCVPLLGTNVVGKHDRYGKAVLESAAGNAYVDRSVSVEIDYGEGRPARIDGTVGAEIAVEIESRTGKQVRGAVLDLICHAYPKKLLVLLPVHMSNAEVIAGQCKGILARFLDPASFRVVVLKGSGYDTRWRQSDTDAVRAALKDLGFGKENGIRGGLGQGE